MMPHLPDLEDLRAFLAVVEHGSLRAAAGTIGETRGTVSRRLTRLERLLGVPLLVRSTRNVTVTRTGTAYAHRVRGILASLRAASGAARADFARPGGQLRVAVPPSYGQVVVAPLISRFLSFHPEISIDIDISDQVVDFEARSLDIAIRGSHKGRLPDTSLVAHRLGAFELACVASPAYLRDMPPVRGTRDLKAHRGVVCSVLDPFMRRPGSRERSDSTLAREIPRTIVCNTFLYQREMILAGSGLGLVPRTLVDQDLAHRRLVEVLPVSGGSNFFTFFLLHRADDPLPPNVRLFRDFVLREIGKARQRSGKPTLRAG